MIAICLLLCVADEAKAANELLDKTIAALGGAKAVAASHTMTGTGKGTLSLGPAQTLTNRFTAQGLDRLRWEVDVNGGTLRLGLHAKGVWIAANAGDANHVDKEVATAFRRGVAALRVVECPTLLRAKGWKLSPLGELKIDDTPAVGLKASRTGEPDIDLWFDAKTHLPVKAEIRLAKPGESAEMTLKATFGDYRNLDGRKHFGTMKVYQDGNKVLEIERTDVKSSDPVAEETFTQP
jgi:hypothetical protein